MEWRPANTVIIGVFLVVIGLAILIAPELLPVLVALTLLVLGIIGILIGLGRRRVF